MIEEEMPDDDEDGPYDLSAIFCESRLEEVVLPSTLRVLRGWVFSHCPLKVVWVEEGCTVDVRGIVGSSVAVLKVGATLGGELLRDLRGLREVVVPEGVEEIGDYTFCQSCVRSVTIAASVQRIGEMAFYKCEELTTVIFASGSALRQIGSYCFAESGLEIIWTPASLRVLGDGAFSGCSRLELAVLNEGLERVECEDAGTFEDSGVRTVVLPSTLRELGKRAFSGCGRLESVSLPRGLRRVGEECFADSGLEE